MYAESWLSAGILTSVKLITEVEALSERFAHAVNSQHISLIAFSYFTQYFHFQAIFTFESIAVPYAAFGLHVQNEFFPDHFQHPNR